MGQIGAKTWKLWPIEDSGKTVNAEIYFWFKINKMGILNRTRDRGSYLTKTQGLLSKIERQSGMGG
jgi:hypothetical protein